MQLANKIIVVTGAGSGMGREMTLQLLKKNAKVVGVDIHENALAKTQKLAGVGDDCFKGFQLDVSNKEKVEALPAAVIAHFGSVDGLINNAGIIQKFIPVNELSYEEGYIHDSLYIAHVGGHEDFEEKLHSPLEMIEKVAKELVVLCDGAIWIKDFFETFYPSATQILDIYHVKSDRRSGADC
jgi:NAD(P)-dependent dehydrogenase (short-subunit alcohol dehydrogenase family)